MTLNHMKIKTAEGTENLAVTQKDYAILLPAVSANFARYADRATDRLGPGGDRHDRCPVGLKQYGSELNYLLSDSGTSFYPYCLYSAGHADMRLDKVSIMEGMIQNRDRKKTLVVGDSGGYQIAKSVIKFDWNNRCSPSAEKVKMEILRWLEHTSDYSMILDIPTYSIINKAKTGVKDFKTCIEGTIENLDFFIKHRKEGATKFLNVLQGRNKEESDIWYEAVKDYPFEGWAFGGMNCSDFELILRRLIKLRDEKLIGKDRHWLHYLGNSRIASACAFTTLQRILRKQVDENIHISFDSSSPYLGASKGFVYTRNSYDSRKMSFLMEKMVDSKKLTKEERDLPFPWQDTPLGKMLTVGDICYKTEKDNEAKSSWDTWSYMMLMSHNTIMQIKATQQGLRLYDLPSRQATNWIPANLLEFKDLAVEVFNSEHPMKLIDEHKKLLNNLIGLKLGRKVSAVERNSLFELEDGEIHDNVEEIDEIGEHSDQIELKDE